VKEEEEREMRYVFEQGWSDSHYYYEREGQREGQMKRKV